MEEIENAMIKVVVGTEKKSKKISDKEKKLTAYHEAGHAIVSRFLKNHDTVHQISIIPRGMAGGYTMYKTTEDKFNCRVITVNGRVTTDFIRTVAEAADKFGSGKVAMTSRMTIEVQGIPYKNVDNFIAFINSKGIECGGTGPKVRPVVSCKGTTCQYGLIDTFSLSEKIHNEFYLKYHNF